MTFSIQNCILYLFVILIVCDSCFGSNGDQTQFFHNCIENCLRQNCTANGLEIQEQAVRYYKQSIFDRLMLWNCADECQYGCMWKSVDAFLDRGWQVPQFYGKWPFVRLLGMQEPASVIFSLLNMLAHVKMLRKFRRKVHPKSPCFMLWHVFSVICINGWLASTVFHTRDFPITELLDYAFAYSMVLAMLYCMIMRMMRKISKIFRAFVSIIFLSFYINYFAYLSVGKFSYSLNMVINLVTGALSAVGWLTWYIFVRKKYSYSKTLLRFYLLFGLSISLELLDFPPILWILDAHALWHLATIPVCLVFYNFIIEDCRRLYKEKYLEESNKLD